MRARIVASVVLAAALTLTATGCSFIANQATLTPYDASDGVSAKVGSIKIENALLLTSNSQRASFLVNIINEGQSAANVVLQYDSTSASGTTTKVDTTVRVDGGDVKTFGGSKSTQLIFTGIDTKAGALFPVFVQYGSKTGEQMLVPVLDGSLPAYSKLLPTPAPTPTPTATVTPTPTPTSTVTP